MTSPATPSAPAPGSSGIPASAPASSATSAPVPTSRRAPIKLAADSAKAVQLALAAEQVAVWAYDLVAAYDVADAALIAIIRNGHLARREATATLLVSGGSKAPAPAPSYSIPAPVTDVVSARALSATVESDCTSAWRAVIGTTDDGALRTVALAGLSDSAVWSTRMKMAAKAKIVTEPFPGQG
jgi:hypothetical protein